MNRIRLGSSGYSLLEITVALTLTTAIVYLAFFMFSKGSESTVYGHNTGIRANLIKSLNTLMNQANSAPTQRAFEPTRTFIPNTGTSTEPYVYAGVWEHGPAAPAPPSYVIPSVSQPVMQFAIGGVNMSHDSYQLEAYRLTKDASGNPVKSTLHALISRCVDAKLDREYLTLAEILALRKPLVVNNQLHCCADPLACPSGDSNSKQFWPTIFIYKGENQVTMLPNKSEREIVPGAGFFVWFNRQRNPDQATFVAFILENRCKLTKIGFADRSPGKCARTTLGYDDAEFSKFDTDIVYQQIMNLSRPLASDLSGSGFMKM